MQGLGQEEVVPVQPPPIKGIDPPHLFLSQPVAMGVGHGPGMTVPRAYAANGLPAHLVTATPLFVAHLLLELAADCPQA